MKRTTTKIKQISLQKYGDKKSFLLLSDMNKMSPVNYLYLMAGVATPTEQDYQWAKEAIVYANTDYWVENPNTHKEYTGRKRFEIKSLSYFMRKRNHNDIEAVRYFQEYEHRELINLRVITSHPAFSCD